MSFIKNTIQCLSCGHIMNIASGTFGYGIPLYCPLCKEKLGYKTIAQGWYADDKKENWWFEERKITRTYFYYLIVTNVLFWLLFLLK